LERIENWQLGPIRHSMADLIPDEATLNAPYEGPTRTARVHETEFRAPPGFDLSEPGAIGRLGRALATDSVRNRQIAGDIRAALDRGAKCLVMSERRAHLDTLAELVPGAEALIMRGGIGRRELTRMKAKMAATGQAEPLLAMTTYNYGGEGLDIPVLDTVFLVGPISFPGRVRQAVGRVLRAHADKAAVTVHDYVDTRVPVLRGQYLNRRRAYRKMGFTEAL
jgi:superfamily II DNA or RNA helicase